MAKKIPSRVKKGRGKNYGRFLKMIDDLQTPKHKTNHKYRSYFPLLSFIIEIKPTIKSVTKIFKKGLVVVHSIVKNPKSSQNRQCFLKMGKLVFIWEKPGLFL